MFFSRAILAAENKRSFYVTARVKKEGVQALSLRLHKSTVKNVQGKYIFWQYCITGKFTLSLFSRFSDYIPLFRCFFLSWCPGGCSREINFCTLYVTRIIIFLISIRRRLGILFHTDTFLSTVWGGSFLRKQGGEFIETHDFLPIFWAILSSVLYIRTWRYEMVQKPFEELTIANDTAKQCTSCTLLSYEFS